MRAIVAGWALALAFAAPAWTAARCVTPSGYPVPRFVTLKFGKINARSGPGDDHRLLWIYRSKGLPVQVVAETSDWRQVKDPDGGKAWIHKRTIDGAQAVLNQAAKPTPLYRKPAPGAVAAYLNAGATAELVRCRKGWCRVKAGGTSGWVRVGSLWGAMETPQCR